MTDEQRTWINNAQAKGGSFVSSFATACAHADDSNFTLLEPVLVLMMEKYSGYSRELTA